MAETFTKGFIEFLELFAHLGEKGNIFPRECRVCKKTFYNMTDFSGTTIPKKHCFEDCRTEKRRFMMFYRHCTCGNTLVLLLTDEMFPELDSFWDMLQRESKNSQRSLQQTTADFADQLDRYLLESNNASYD
jgi:hypothetical protein